VRPHHGHLLAVHTEFERLARQGREDTLSLGNVERQHCRIQEELVSGCSIYIIQGELDEYKKQEMGCPIVVGHLIGA
jgi:hypothetical protein